MTIMTTLRSLAISALAVPLFCAQAAAITITVDDDCISLTGLVDTVVDPLPLERPYHFKITLFKEGLFIDTEILSTGISIGELDGELFMSPKDSGFTLVEHANGFSLLIDKKFIVTPTPDVDDLYTTVSLVPLPAAALPFALALVGLHTVRPLRRRKSEIGAHVARPNGTLRLSI